MRKEVPRVLEDVSVLLLPSFQEGLPTVVIEAMSCGIPSIAYDVGGVKEIIRDGETGYVVPQGDINGFVDKTLQLLSDRKRYELMRGLCFLRARTMYDWKVVTNKIEEVYNEVCKRT